ncbi:ATP-binding protein [Umboniibacter marinipuniceus]|uniref:AAA domain-containing protein n=1 Tax=Umboniibacter marinipuniceus TaxID=569599 RepID=A0A3M0ABY4_9GAMM|nr:ATP-binding protein [Umboniibacter marinipuniceus]RMA82420.1 AAA domain-containing protein [Umboniibacter marinipuniceus]
MTQRIQLERSSLYLRVGLALLLALLYMGLSTQLSHAAVPLNRGIPADRSESTLDYWTERLAQNSVASEREFRQFDSDLNHSINQFKLLLQSPQTTLSDVGANRRLLAGLIDLRRRIFAQAPPALRREVYGFGELGVLSAKTEFAIVDIATHAHRFEIQQTIYSAESGWQLSAMIEARLAGQLTLLLIGFVVWRFRIVPQLQVAAVNREYSVSRWRSTLSWLLLSMRRPLEFLVLLWAVMEIISSELPRLDFSILHDALFWAVGSFLLARLIYTIGATEYRRNHTLDRNARKRWQVIFTAATIGALIGFGYDAAHDLNLAKMTLETWYLLALIPLSLPLVVFHCAVWREHIFETLARVDYQSVGIAKWCLRHQSGFSAWYVVPVAAIYLSWQWLSRSVLAVLAENPTFRILLSYLFQAEVAKQVAKSEGEEPKLLPISQSQKDEIVRGPGEHIPVDEALSRRITALVNLNRSTISLIHGARASGKTALLRGLAKQLTSQQHEESISVRIVDCPRGDFEHLLEAMQAQSFNDAQSASEVISYLRDGEEQVICIDNAHRLVTPTIGGLGEFERLIRLIRRSSDSISWILTIDTAAWRFIQRARGERFKFDLEDRMPIWASADIQQLIDSTNASLSLKLSFDRLNLPRQFDELVQPSDEELATIRFRRILSDYCGGNPGIALQLWSQSLFIDPSIPSTYLVQVFDISRDGTIDNLSVSLHLVLRSILQLELAIRSDIENATKCSSEEVIDALRLLGNLGVVERTDQGFYRVTWLWYREVCSLMQRKHLLVMGELKK